MLECIVICRFMILNNLLHKRLGVTKIYFTNKSYCSWELILSFHYYSYLSTLLMSYKVKRCVNLIFMKKSMTGIWIFFICGTVTGKSSSRDWNRWVCTNKSLTYPMGAEIGQTVTYLRWLTFCGWDSNPWF